MCCLNNIFTASVTGLKQKAMKAAVALYFNNTFCKCSKESKVCRPVKECAPQCPAAKLVC